MGLIGSHTPQISVCIPAYNAASTIDEALESVWRQSFEDFEIVLVDDHSTDATLEVVRRHRDGRLRILQNDRNLGVALTTNHAISRARGPLIKFLDSDDLLAPDALVALSGPLDACPQATISFCRRSAFLEDPSDHVGQQWVQDYSGLPDRFRALAPMNSGRGLLREWLAAGASGNWIGEPVCVMARRDAVLRAGGENPRVQDNDTDLWVKLLALGDAGFVDDELARYRVRRTSLTDRTNDADDRGWLDTAWLLQDLWGLDDLHATEPMLRAARREALVFVAKRYARSFGTPGTFRRLCELRSLARSTFFTPMSR